MSNTFRIFVIVLTAALAAPLAHAEIIIYGSQTDHPLVPGLDLTGVRMSVDLSVTNSLATFRFANVSVGEETAVFKEIVLDTHDDDDATAFLWNGTVLTQTQDVAYTIGLSNGLPGYHSQTSDAFPLVELDARPSPVKKGIGPGEVLEVRFETSLADGSDIYDYLAAFGGGQDTQEFSIGFHAISASVVNGQSLSGAAVPEPATAMLLASGGLALLRRRRRQT